MGPRTVTPYDNWKRRELIRGLLARDDEIRRLKGRTIDEMVRDNGSRIPAAVAILLRLMVSEKITVQEVRKYAQDK